MEQDESVFIKIDKYKDANEIIKVVRARIAEGKEVLGKINELKNKEDAEISQWSTELEDIERKIEFIDSTLFEPQV